VSHYNSDHGDTARTLDFQRTDIEYSAQRITCIKPILEDKVIPLHSRLYALCQAVPSTLRTSLVGMDFKHI
jgi:hypothetical protein